jgi:salicylate hydroxylase
MVLRYVCLSAVYRLAYSLTLSLCLTQIFERSLFSNEIGAAIHICPNATRVLRSFGFNFQQARADDFGSGTVMRGDTMERTYYGSYENWEKEYGALGYFLHRVDLHGGLRGLALNSGMGSGGAARINLGAEVVDLDCEAGRIELADGRVFTKDVVVIADGVHSRFVHKIAGDISPARRTGQSIFRFLIPTEKLRANPVTTPLFPESEPSGVRIAVLGNRRMVWYPCRNGTVQNCALIHADERYSEKVEDYHAKASKEDLLVTYKAFHPALVEMCNQAEDIKLWPLLYRRPNPTWTKGRAVLIGDAAHPMLPHQGQGGAQGLEDGAALGVILSRIPEIASAPTFGSDSARSSLSDDSDFSLGGTDLDAVIAERLHLFQEIRKNRTAAVQIFSNAGQDEAKKIVRDARPYVNGKVPTNQQEFHQYSYGYDVVEDCSQALKRLQGRGSKAMDLKEELRPEVGRCNL